MDFDYDGGGWAKGADLRLSVNDKPIGKGRLPASPPAHFSISETFDVGIDSGSPAGRYPTDARLGFPFSGGRIERVDINLR